MKKASHAESGEAGESRYAFRGGIAIASRVPALAARHFFGFEPGTSPQLLRDATCTNLHPNKFTRPR